MKRNIRVLSFFLALLMLLSALPAEISTALAEKTPLTSASVTLRRPLDGSTTKVKPNLLVPDGAGYSIYQSGWYQENEYAPLNSSQAYTFRTGKQYALWFKLRPNNGCEFSVDPDKPFPLTLTGATPQYEPDPMYDQTLDCTVILVVANFVVPESCTVSFAAGGGSGSMDAVAVEKGAAYKLPACGFTAPEGKEFDSWDKGAPGTQITVTADTLVKALWKDLPQPEPVMCSVVFMRNGGKGKMAPIKVQKGTVIQLPPNQFTHKSGAFMGWTLISGGTKYLYEDEALITVDKDLVLYARWARVKLRLKKVKVRRSAKKLVLTASLSIKGKKQKGKTLIFSFNGKTYKAKTKKNGVAKVTIKKAVLKKLKVGQKITIKVAYRPGNQSFLASFTTKVKK